MTVSQSGFSALICIQSSTCFVCVMSLLFHLPLCLAVWAACKGVYTSKVSQCDSVFDRLSCFLGALL